MSAPGRDARFDPIPRRSFGPMHGERTRRHQMVVDGTRSPVIVTAATSPVASSSEERGDGKRLWIEFMHRGGGLVGALLTPAECEDLRDWLTEYIEAMKGESV